MSNCEMYFNTRTKTNLLSIYSVECVIDPFDTIIISYDLLFEKLESGSVELSFIFIDCGVSKRELSIRK